MTRLTTLIIFLSCLALTGAQAKILSEHGDWFVSVMQENGSKVCYLSAEPQKAEGNYTKRGPIYLTITHRPAEKRIGEVGVQAGYTYKNGSSVTAVIDGKTKVRMFTNAGFAWGESEKADQSLIRAMKAGNKIVITGTSSRGTKTTDTYSLAGFTAAYNASIKACAIK